MNTSVSYQDTVRAYEYLRKQLSPTPLTLSKRLSERFGHEVFIKWESKQRTGSFKERGALFFLSQLAGGSTVCAASAGNHALGLSFHAQRRGVRCVLVMPKNAPLVKLQAAEKRGAEVFLEGDSYDEAREFAKDLAARKQYVFVPAFDHPHIIAGQGSLGHELLEQLSNFTSIICPVGGGGLFAGICLVMKEKRPEVSLLGVQSEWSTTRLYSSVPFASLAPGTIADGIAVKTLGSLTGSIIKDSGANLISVTEDETASGMVQFLELEQALVEGSAAVVLAALQKHPPSSSESRTVLIVSGANVDLNVMSRLISREMAKRSRLVRIRLSVPDRPGCLHTLTGVIASTRANVLEVFHDRSFSDPPGNVEITVVIEVRDTLHREEVINNLRGLGVGVTVVSNEA